MNKITYDNIYKIFDTNYNDNMNNQIIKTNGVTINVKYQNKSIEILFDGVEMIDEIELLDICKHIMENAENWIWVDMDIVAWEIAIDNGFHDKPNIYIAVVDYAS